MCIFCDIIDHKIPSSVVYEDEQTLAILDLSQVTRGHTIVMPKQHTDNILTADEETAVAVLLAAKKVAALLVEKTGAAGVNLLNNCGEAAGQTVNHLHIHVIPRFDETDGIGITFTANEQADLPSVLESLK
ncbi:MAG: HIT family protein [Solobacterium sp.]|nr:HIT family protein [Solobacterium sp.]